MNEITVSNIVDYMNCFRKWKIPDQDVFLHTAIEKLANSTLVKNVMVWSAFVYLDLTSRKRKKKEKLRIFKSKQRLFRIIKKLSRGLSPIRRLTLRCVVRRQPS